MVGDAAVGGQALMQSQIETSLTRLTCARVNGHLHHKPRLTSRT